MQSSARPLSCSVSAAHLRALRRLVARGTRRESGRTRCGRPLFGSATAIGRNGDTIVTIVGGEYLP
jgi:hypothetical protein